MRKVGVLIAGAGPCGLAAALEMMESGPGGNADFLLVDSRTLAGGWASSETTPEGFTFDFGGHVLFPHKKYARFSALLDSLPILWDKSVPRRGVRVQGSFLPYPAQRNLQRLPMAKLARVVMSVAKRRTLRHEKTASLAKPGEGNLQAYLLGRFGIYVTKLLMEPLNRKQWAHPIETLTDVWVANRSGSKTPNVANMKLRRLIGNLLLRRDDVGWEHDTRVAYPASGGSGAIWSAVADRIAPEKMLLGSAITSLSLEQKTAELSTGEVIQWEHFVSTMPLDTLLRMLGTERPELAEKADLLVRTRSRLFGFGVCGELPANFHGLHSCQFTAPDVPFWRLNFPMTVSKGNGPEGCYSLLCEVNEPASQPPLADTRAQVQAQLFRMGLLGRAGLQLVSVVENTVEHGYPVPFLGRDELLGQIQPLLEKEGIYSRGRFGSWRYEISNQDYTFMQGIEVVQRILFGTPEETFGTGGAAAELQQASTPEQLSTLVPMIQLVREVVS